MIYLQNIHIYKFRGIRDLTLDLKGENFAICGPNGTGKSGVVDAIEFALTGNISRLCGHGTGELSVKAHGPHVDSRSKPEQAYVSLTFKIPTLNKEATIKRAVKNPSKSTIIPNNPEIKAAIAHITKHPEFVLSRRELMRYVLAEPGERSKEIQALLRLDKIDALRSTLLRISKACERDSNLQEENKSRVQVNLLRALNIDNCSPSAVLREVNKYRTILGLPELDEFNKDTAITDGLMSVKELEMVSHVPKVQALKDIEALQKLLDGLKDKASLGSRAAILQDLKDLNADGDSLEKLSHENLLQSALLLFDAEHCPICDTEWKPEELRTKINEKLQWLTAIRQRKLSIETQISPFISDLDALSVMGATIGMYGDLQGIAGKSLQEIEGLEFKALGSEEIE